MTTKAQLSGERGTFLTCPDHPWVRYSATPGDYFWAGDDETFPCDFTYDDEVCRREMVEAREECSVVEVTR